VIGLLGGLGAALSWAAAALTAARCSRAIGATPTLGWVMLVGLVVVAPTLAFVNPGTLSVRTIGWLVLAGAGNVAGLALEYLALRAGPVGVVAPLCSTEGAIAAVIAAVFGQVPSAAVLAPLAVILIGVVLSSAGGGDADAPGPQHVARAALLSVAAAILFGINLYALARAGGQASVVWTLWPARVIGTVAVALPLAARGRLTLPGRAWPYAVGAGIAEVTGILAYALGARHGVAVPAVVGSQFAGLAALGGYLLLGERIDRRQLAGLIVIAVGVATLAALQA
jgi:drug/metabolite transporter (DMT)-like permease